VEGVSEAPREQPGDTRPVAVMDDDSEPEENDPAEAFSESNGLHELIATIDAEMQHRRDELYVEEHLRQRSPVQQDTCIVFSLDGTRYAFPIRSVLEVDAMPRITAVPNVPDFVCGVTNVRGEVIAVLDLRLLLGLIACPLSQYRLRQRLAIFLI
jgi:purine-binding chemotaxis protein CheW